VKGCQLEGVSWNLSGIETAIGCHTFRATGITDYPTSGGRTELAQRMAGRSNAKTTLDYTTAAMIM